MGENITVVGRVKCAADVLQSDGLISAVSRLPFWSDCVSSIYCSDWLSAGLSQNPVQVLRKNTTFFPTTHISYHPAIKHTQTQKHNIKSNYFNINNFVFLLPGLATQFKTEYFWKKKNILPHSRHFLVQQLDDIAAVKDDVISAGHAALYHDPVPARHLGQKRRQEQRRPDEVEATNERSKSSSPGFMQNYT